MLAPRRGLFANGLKPRVGTFSKTMEDPPRSIFQFELKAIPLTFKCLFPEMSNSVSPPAEPGVYLNEIIAAGLARLAFLFLLKGNAERRCSYRLPRQITKADYETIC